MKNAAKVTVTLIDGRTFDGLVRGTDEFMDLAAIRIKPSGKPLPTAPLGRSDELQVFVQVCTPLPTHPLAPPFFGSDRPPAEPFLVTRMAE